MNNFDKLPHAYSIYTDGSCRHDDRIGGWAWVAIDNFGEETHGGGSDVDTTISRMEIIAAIDALEYLYERCGPCDVVIYSDSEYVVKGITDRSRKRNKNVDLWAWLDDITDAHGSVEYKHVRGHQGNHFNEMVDGLANDFRLERRESNERNC